MSQEYLFNQDEIKAITQFKKTMKLETKHLAPYLPYGLKCIFTDKENTGMGTMNALYDDGTCSFSDVVESSKGFSEVKPILRPLSDLTKEITHNGGTFVPMERIFFDKWNEWDGEIKCLLSMRDTYNASKGKVLPMFLQGWVLENLYRCHFDTQNLIENGLAVDINTLEK